MVHAERRSRLMPDRRRCEIGPPQGVADRRAAPERRRPCVSEIQFREWADAMSNYYFHFHGSRT